MMKTIFSSLNRLITGRDQVSNNSKNEGCDPIPTEIWCNIFSFVSDITDLASCVLVSRRWQNIVTPCLYQDIDLRQRKYDEEYTDALLRQKKLLYTLDRNPYLASLAKNFKNHKRPGYRATDMCSQRVLQSAANNMIYLQSVSIGDCPIGAHILCCIGQYPQLKELYVSRLSPRDLPWQIWSTSIKKIHWQIVADDLCPLLRLVERTCMLLEILDIGIIRNSDGPNKFPAECRLCSRCATRGSTPNLMSMDYPLQHLHTVRLSDHTCESIGDAYFRSICSFLENHRASIRHFTLPVAMMTPPTTSPHLCRLYKCMPNMDSFGLTRSEPLDRGPTSIAIPRLLYQNAYFIRNNEIRRACVESLTLIDKSNFANDRILKRLNTHKSVKEICIDAIIEESDSLVIKHWMKDQVTFIFTLPKTLQVLHLKITPKNPLHMSKIFKAAKKWYTTVFRCLPYLHTFDISIHQNGYLIPVIASHLRRLPYDSRLKYATDSTWNATFLVSGDAQSAHPQSLKTLWRSVMKRRNGNSSGNGRNSRNDGDHLPRIKHDYTALHFLPDDENYENDDNSSLFENSVYADMVGFLGPDADGVWCDGDLAGVRERMMMTRVEGSNEEHLKTLWPNTSGYFRDIAVCYETDENWI